MYPVGIIILIFSLVSITLPLIFQKKIRFFLNKYYIILSLISIFCWLYFFIGRYVFNIIDFIEYNESINDIKYSQLLSKLLLLDMCPLMAFLLPIFSIFKKTRKIALILCPITIIGSCITIFGQIIWTKPFGCGGIDINQFAQFFFIGIKPNRMYFMMHFLTLMLAILILITNYKFNWKDLIYTLLFYFIWIFYVEIMVISLNIKANASGLVEYDWLNNFGQYHTMYLIWPLPFPEIVIFWYFIIIFVNCLIVLLKNIFTRKLNNNELKTIYYQPNKNYIIWIKQYINKNKY